MKQGWNQGIALLVMVGFSVGACSEATPLDQQPAPLPLGTQEPILPGGADAPAVAADCLVASDCPQGAPCTVPTCDHGICGVAAPATPEPCDDGDPCTESDTCTASGCVGSPMICDDGVVCTNDYCWEGGCKNTPSKDEECAVSLVISEPLRAATLVGNGPITVKGHVLSPAGPVANLQVGDLLVVPGPDGAFEVEVDAMPGLVVLEVEASDTFERSARRVLTVAKGADVHLPGTPVTPTLLENGFGLWLSPSFFDDDSPDLDDVSTLVELLLGALDLNAAIPHPLFPPGEEPTVAFCSWEVDLQNVQHTPGPVDIAPVSGGLSLKLELQDLTAKLDAESVACPDAVGDVTIDQILVDAVVAVTQDDGAIAVHPTSVDVQLVGLAVDLQEDGSALNGVIDLVKDQIQVLLQEELEVRIPEAVLPAIQGVLSSISGYHSTVAVPSVADIGVPLDVSYKILPGELSFADAGGVLSLQAGFSAVRGIPHNSPGSLSLGPCTPAVVALGGVCCSSNPQDAGCEQPSCEDCVCDADPFCCTGQWDALCAQEASSGCDASCGCSHTAAASLALEQAQPFEAFFQEDLINQLLFSIWWGGHARFELGSEHLGGAVEGVDLQDLSISVDPMLPPVVSTCTPTGALELQVGEIRADASFMIGGQPAGFSLFATTRIAMDVGVNEQSGEIAMVPDGISFFDYEIESTHGMGAIGDTVITGLMNSLVEDYIVDDVVEGLSAGYPVPVVDISPWLPGAMSSTALTLKPEQLAWEAGYLHLGGAILEP